MPSRRRAADRLRRVRITPEFIPSADGSCLITLGRTRVVCTATIEDRVPRWLLGSGGGWVTAEYGMLPASATERIRRPGPGGTSSRGTEIRRLIGRALRAGTRLDALGKNQVIVDCDVLEADGGTRCAAVTGGKAAVVAAAGDGP
ncbi:MAG: ribonuclease PH, partial [Phycisphaerae bacterium]